MPFSKSKFFLKKTYKLNFKKFIPNNSNNNSLLPFYKNSKLYLNYVLHRYFILKKFYLNLSINFTLTYTKIFIHKNFKSLNTLLNSKTLTNNFLVPTKSLIMSFKRHKFFPTLISNAVQKGHTYSTLSLCFFLQFFHKPKSFKKSKQLYLLLINFFKKLFLYASINVVSLKIKFIPKYLIELLNILLSPVLKSHVKPFTNTLSSDYTNQPIFLKNLIFYSTKHYGFIKNRKKGVVKRKVTRKVFKNNSILD